MSILIIETTDNRLFSARDIGLPQAWAGTPVKRVRGEYVAKAGATETLVRKAGSRIVVEG